MNAKRALSITLSLGLLPSKWASGVGPAPKIDWKLAQEETFTAPIGEDHASWRKVTPGSSDPMDDDGQFFHVLGGPAFTRQLRTFDTYRKTFRFGKDGWLTAELSARDGSRSGEPLHPPTLKNGTVAGRPAALLEEPDHHGGILIRGTHPLPARYRIEMELAAIDFGGSRHGRWSAAGKLNGYDERGAKTRHPWPFGKSDEFSKASQDWLDVRFANGFYYLAILDTLDPFPRNNVYIHHHRKVAIDSYTVDQKAAFELCDPVTRRLSVTQDNTVNLFFLAPGSSMESQPVSETECGTFYGSENVSAPAVSAAQLEPERMPEQSYRFAIERDATGYTLEVSGPFKSTGARTFRYHREFMQDKHPIWHFNQKADQYDGSYDKPWSYEGPFGRFTIPHSWPKGSAYPDSFIIGDPHTNYYEGSAAIRAIRLYVPAARGE